MFSVLKKERKKEIHLCICSGVAYYVHLGMKRMPNIFTNLQQEVFTNQGFKGLIFETEEMKTAINISIIILQDCKKKKKKHYFCCCCSYFTVKY